MLYIDKLLTEEFFHTEILSSLTEFYSRKDGEFYCTRVTSLDGTSKSYIGNGLHKKMDIWMSFLGFSNSDHSFQSEISLLNLKNTISLWQDSFSTPDSIKHFASNLLSTYSTELHKCPFIQMYFSYIHSILFHCYQMSIGKEGTGYTDLIKDSCSCLCSDIESIIANLPLWRDYVIQAQTVPYNLGYIRKPSQYFQSYNAKLAYFKKSNPYAKAMFINHTNFTDTFPYTPNDTFKNVQTYSNSDLDGTNNDGEFIMLLESDNLLLYDDYRFSGQFVAGIDYLIETDSIIKQCPCCNQFFLCKYSAIVTYCSNPYKGKATCQEYMAQKNYREKKSSDPFHIAYNRIYRRIYSRLRRGSISEEEAKLSELLELKNKYIIKYQNSTKREKIIKEFIAEAESLYH